MNLIIKNIKPTREARIIIQLVLAIYPFLLLL